MLEHYVNAILPFGGRHTDAATNLETMVPKRLQKNAPLHTFLREGIRRISVQESGLPKSTIMIPFDWDKFQRWLEFVVKGLAWHHWKVLIGPDCHIDVIELKSYVEEVFQRLRTMDAAKRVREDIGDGTFIYEASQGTDSPLISVWEFSIYGGIALAVDSIAPRQTVSRIGVLVGPRRVFERVQVKDMWLKGQGNKAS